MPHRAPAGPFTITIRARRIERMPNTVTSSTTPERQLSSIEYTRRISGVREKIDVSLKDSHNGYTAPGKRGFRPPAPRPLLHSVQVGTLKQMVELLLLGRPQSLSAPSSLDNLRVPSPIRMVKFSVLHTDCGSDVRSSPSKRRVTRLNALLPVLPSALNRN